MRASRWNRAVPDAPSEPAQVVQPPHAPQADNDIINHSVGRVLDLFGIDPGLVRRWSGRPLRPDR